MSSLLTHQLKLEAIHVLRAKCPEVREPVSFDSKKALVREKQMLYLCKKQLKMAVQTQKKLFTVDEYYKMAEVGILEPDDRVELIHGEILKMSPIKSFHASIVDALNEILVLLLHGKAIVKSQNPLHIDNYSEPEPDLTIAHFHPHKYRHQHPRPEDVHFLIEVADTTLQKDRKIKLPLYAEAGIAEVWIVNLKNHTVEVYTNPIAGSYQELNTLKIGDVLRFAGLGLELEVGRIFE